MTKTRQTTKNPSTVFDTRDTSNFSSLYEITAKIADGKTIQCVLEACKAREALEVFNSIPEIRGLGLEVAEIKRVMHGVYWVRS